MKQSKRHYYKLAGESLNALNRLLRHTGIKEDLRALSLRAQGRAALAETNPDLAERMYGKEDALDPATLEKSLANEFTAAQLRCYHAALGLFSPSVQVTNYNNGLLYRAHTYYPEIAINPADGDNRLPLFGKEKTALPDHADRIAIYVVPEDYKGRHFVPPGAVELTEDEFTTYAANEDDFNLFRAPREVAPLPQDFDPQSDQVLDYETQRLNGTHTFLVTGKSLQALQDHAKASQTWHQPYQEFRDKGIADAFKKLTGRDIRPNVWLEEPLHDGDTRKVELTFTTNVWDEIQDAVKSAFTICRTEEEDFDQIKLTLTPREESFIGHTVSLAFAKVPPHPVDPDTALGYKNRPILQNSFSQTPQMTGFPYMKVERYEDSHVFILAFRMPAHIKTILPPENCTVLSPEDYAALAGAEPGFNPQDLPTHAFRIEGPFHDLMAGYYAALDEYTAKKSTYEEELRQLIDLAAPGCTPDKLELEERSWQEEKRQVGLILPERLVTKTLLDLLEERFSILHNMTNGGTPFLDRRHMTLQPKREGSDDALSMAAAMDAVPLEPNFPRDVALGLGFYLNQGYDHFKIEDLFGTDQKVFIHYMPSYITEVTTPGDCIPLTREEHALLAAEGADAAQGSALVALRPPHLAHLPLPDVQTKGTPFSAQLQNPDTPDLPLHHDGRGWFKIRR